MSDRPRALLADPGFAAMGVSVVELAPPGERHTVLCADVWTTEPSDKKLRVLAASDDNRRARELSRRLLDLTAQWGPRVFLVEAKSMPRNASSSCKVGQALGVLACVAEAHRVPLSDVSPGEVRRNLGLVKNASKEDVFQVVRAGYRDGHLIDEVLLAHVPRGRRHHAHDSLAVLLACEAHDVVRVLRG